MLTDELYELVNRLLPPIAVALIALAAVLSSLAHARLRRHPRAILLAVGTANVALAYAWVYFRGLSLAERAIIIRLAIVSLLLSILIYNERAWPWLSNWLWRRRKK
jgi:hypothetical protein